MDLLHHLALRGADLGIQSGYAPQSVDAVLLLSETGAFRSLTPVDARVEMLPVYTHGVRVCANTAVDNVYYTLGAGGYGRGPDAAIERAKAFLDVVVGIDHPAARAIAAFRNDPGRPLIAPLGGDLTPEQVEALRRVPPSIETGILPRGTLLKRGELTDDPVVLRRFASVLANAEASHPDPSAAKSMGVTGSFLTSEATLLFEVEGHPRWWLDPVVVATHQRRMQALNDGEKGSVSGGCSICGQSAPLARTFPAVSLGGPSCLVSFNAAGWRGYGRDQAYNAPTCTTCASSLGLGFDDLLSDPSARFSLKDLDHTLLLWGDQGGLWETFEAALDLWAPPEIRESALQHLLSATSVRFAIVQKTKMRLALRGFAPIDVGELASRIRRWWDALLPVEAEIDAIVSRVGEPKPGRFLWGLSCTATRSGGKQGKSDRAPALAREALYQALLTGFFPVSLYRKLGSWPLEEPDRFVNRRRRALHTWASGLMENLVTPAPTPLERYAYYLGRAFRVAERCQARRSAPQKTIRHTRYRSCSTNPALAYAVISENIAIRISAKKMGTSARGSDLLAKARVCLETEPGCPASVPVRFTPRATAQFHLGYNAEVADDKEYWRLKEEERANSEQDSAVSEQR
jgi:hypothetical protein